VHRRALLQPTGFSHEDSSRRTESCGAAFPSRRRYSGNRRRKRTLLGRSRYRTLIRPVLLLVPPTEICSAYAPDASGGTWIFTWYSPANRGASPANCTGAAAPPIVAVTPNRVERGAEGAAAPVATGGFTSPNPVTYADMTLPTAAGRFWELTDSS